MQAATTLTLNHVSIINNEGGARLRPCEDTDISVMPQAITHPDRNPSVPALPDSVHENGTTAFPLPDHPEIPGIQSGYRNSHALLHIIDIPAHSESPLVRCIRQF